MVRLYSDNAKSTLLASVLASDAALTLVDGSSFPSPGAGDYFVVTITDQPELVRERVRVLSRAGGVLTVVRGQEGTTARDWPAGSKVELRLTARGMMDVVLPNMSGRDIKIWAPGDSRTVGNTRAGWRRTLWQNLRRLGYNIQMLGHQPLDSNAFDGYAFTLGDWRYSGVNGRKWQDLTANLDAEAAVAGAPDVVYCDLGINNCAYPEAPATTQANAQAGILALAAKFPDIPIRIGTISQAFASSQTVVDNITAYNAWLLTQVWPTNVTIIDLGSSIAKDDKLADGIHENPQGNSKQALILVDDFRKLFPMPNGLPMPRPLSPILAQPAISIVTDTTDYFRALNANAGCGIEAAKSYLISFWHYPKVTDATQRNIISFGADYTQGWALFTQNNQILPYLPGGNLLPASGALPFHTMNAWHRYVFGLFKQTSASDPRPCFGLWVDGRLAACGHVAAWADSAAAQMLTVGYLAGMGKPGDTGYTNRIGIHKWSGAPYLDSAREHVERDYYEGKAFPGRVAYYPCSEGAGTALDVYGGPALTKSTNATWIAAGVAPMPCDG